MVLFAPLTFQMNLNFRAKKVEYIFYCTTGWQSNFGEYIALKVFGQKSISSFSNKFTNFLQYNNHNNHFWENLFLLSNYLEFCWKPPEDCTGCPGKFWTEYWAIFQSLIIRLGVVGLDDFSSKNIWTKLNLTFSSFRILLWARLTKVRNRRAKSPNFT